MVDQDPDGLDFHIQALTEWEENLNKILELSGKDDVIQDQGAVRTSKEVESNKTKCLALCLVGNVSFINSVVDSDLFKALCISFFDKHFHLPKEPYLIFVFLIETFKPWVEHNEPDLTPVKRGEYLFKLLRSFQSLRATYDLLTMIFVCISRNYGTCARIVCKYPSTFPLGNFIHFNSFSESVKNQGIWCEFFDTKESSWKYVDFSTPKFDQKVYEYKQSEKTFPNLSRGLKSPENKDSKESVSDHGPDCSEDREVETEMDFEWTYKNYLYVQRGLKVFIYRKLDKLKVRKIVVFPKYTYRTRRMLYVKEFPFETKKNLENLKTVFSGKHQSPSRASGSSKAPLNSLFVLTCNIGGILSEVTPKYVHKNISYKRTKTFLSWFQELLVNINQKIIRSHVHNCKPKTEVTAITSENNDMLKGSIDILNANLLEKVDSKFISNLISNFPIPTKAVQFVNHPIYVLKSQIKKNQVLKENAMPVTTFGTDLVYFKSDLEEVKTTLGWYKENRKVKANQNPVKQVTSSMKRTIDYYTLDQTEVLDQDKMDELDRFTVNLSGNRYVPKDSTYIRSIHPSILEKICHRNRIFFKRAFSSLHYERGSLKPKIDGVLIRNSDLDNFLNLYSETVETLVKEHLNEELFDTCKFWKNLFKTFLNSPPLKRAKSVRSIRNIVGDHSKGFLNQLD